MHVHTYEYLSWQSFTCIQLWLRVIRYCIYDIYLAHLFMVRLPHLFIKCAGMQRIWLNMKRMHNMKQMDCSNAQCCRLLLALLLTVFIFYLVMLNYWLFVLFVYGPWCFYNRRMMCDDTVDYIYTTDITVKSLKRMFKL